jgi:hypothetical protein
MLIVVLVAPGAIVTVVTKAIADVKPAGPPLLCSVTTAPPEGAGPFSVTVKTGCGEPTPPITSGGETVSEEMNGVPDGLIHIWALLILPLKVA